jgi:hypothetical protein
MRAPVPRNQLIDVDDNQPGLLIAGELLRESDRAIPGIRSVVPVRMIGNMSATLHVAVLGRDRLMLGGCVGTAPAMGSSRHLTGSRRSRA